KNVSHNPRFRVGIVGVSGYGGGEALRLCASHPNFDLVYVAGEGSAGQKLVERFPGIGAAGELKSALVRVPEQTRIVDIGGDHRYVEGWTYGLADVWPDRIRQAKRVANPGCYPAATLAALAPLVANKLVEPTNVIIDAKSGVSGAGRGGGGT